MDCRDKILSNSYFDVIIDYPVGQPQELGLDICSINIDDMYNAVYVNRIGQPSIMENVYDYPGIPKLYGLMQLDSIGNLAPFDPNSLAASGILQVQREPLALTGRGTVICIIDTGEGVILLSNEINKIKAALAATNMKQSLL